MNLPAEIKVELRGGVPMVSSLQVAERFKKRHDHVIRSIRQIIATELAGDNLPCAGEIEQNIYFPDTYLDARGRQQPVFWMTRDGFLALTMPFSGKEAASLRWAVIRALNQAEVVIRRGVEALDIPLMLEMAAKEYRRVMDERDAMADEVVAARQQQRLIAHERTKDIDRVREAERRVEEAKQKVEAVAKHAYRAQKELEELMRGGSIGDLFSSGEAENITRLPVKKKDEDGAA